LPAEATTPRRTTRALEARLGANCARVAGIAAAEVMAAMVGRFLRDGGRSERLGFEPEIFIFSRSVVSTAPRGVAATATAAKKIQRARRARARDTRGMHALLNGVAYEPYAGVTDVGARDRSRRLLGEKNNQKFKPRIANRGSAIAKVEREPKPLAVVRGFRETQRSNRP